MARTIHASFSCGNIVFPALQYASSSTLVRGSWKIIRWNVLVTLNVPIISLISYFIL